MAIYEQNNATDTKWGRGELQVMIKSPTSDKPFGYCDGTREDEEELVTMAEKEGVSRVEIQHKRLKTGREIWTVTGEGMGGEQESSDFW